YTYTAQGLLDTINGPRTDVADVTDFNYNSQGNLTSITNALNQVTQISSHDAHGNPLTITDANGVTSSLTYDLRQRLLTRTVAGATTSFDYDDVGNLTRLTLPTGGFLSYSYDTTHRLTDIQDNQGNKIHYTLDAAGNRTKEEVFDPSNVLKRQLRQEYDNQSRLKKILGANGQVTEYGYDNDGNRTSSTEATSFTTSTEYDALDRMLKVTDAASGETRYGYNALDQLTSVTDPKNLTTSYSHNAFGEVAQQVSPDTGTTTHTYDAAGNRLSRTDARSITVRYSYDALNRLARQDYSGSTEDVTYFYDGANYGRRTPVPAGTPNGIGRLTGVQDQTGDTAFAYDPRGNLQQQTRIVRKVIYRTHYEYDLQNRLLRMTYPNGRVLTFERNALGQITRLSTKLAGVSAVLVENVDYLPFGPESGWSLGNGLGETRAHDQDYRVTRIQTGAIQDLGYYYDTRNNIDAIQNGLDTSRSQSFDYDALSRLTGAQGIYGNLGYGYDAIGNRLSETNDGVTDNYTYSAGSHRLSSITQGNTTTAFSYDAVGNVTGKAGQSFSYNAANRLSQATSASGGTSYTYNARGQRVIKTAGRTVTVYHHDQAGNLIAETDKRGNVQKEYVYFNGKLLAQFVYRQSGKRLLYD
ncbi:MAG: hypothetical protein ACRESW_07105, partial [Nevskiales bacterium]